MDIPQPMKYKIEYYSGYQKEYYPRNRMTAYAEGNSKSDVVFKWIRTFDKLRSSRAVQGFSKPPVIHSIEKVKE